MLVLHGVDAAYGGASVLRGLTMHVDAGEVVVVLGRNGMGKTSTIRTIMGFDAPRRTGGHLALDGRRLDGLPSHAVARLGIGYVPQGRRIFPSLTVAENLGVVARAARHDTDRPWDAGRVGELFPQLADRSNQRGGSLSGGEQQMLAIARALMTNPRLLLLDEPTEGLAPPIVRQVGQAVDRLREEGMTVLVAEQDVRFALGLADRVVVLESGTVVAEGSPSAIDGDEALKRRYLGVG